jgi:hypothetical protein
LNFLLFQLLHHHLFFKLIGSDRVGHALAFQGADVAVNRFLL